MPSCPSETTLRLIGTGVLGAATFASLEAHIAQCAHCLARLERLAKSPEGETLCAVDHLPAPDVMPTVPGFVVERELGRGSAGVVYRARQPGLERYVALKIIPGGPLAGPRGRARWLAEARAVSPVRHPNVVRLYSAERTAEWLVLVLEYVPGGTLKDRLTSPLPPKTSAALVEAVAVAVEHIHRLGLLHLDLKPSNILLDGEPETPLEQCVPKISDFGIARIVGDPASSDGSLAGPRGTPSYMAPEQAAPGAVPIGRAADVYALGAILYHLLTGQPPFQSASVLEVLDLIRTQEPVAPRRLNHRIPSDLETICLTCLNKEPARRYDSAAALAADLRRWLDGRPIAARSATPFEHAWRWCRRRPLTAALMATLAATILTSFAGLVALLRHSEAERARAVAARKTAQANYQVASNSLNELLRLTIETDIGLDVPTYFPNAWQAAMETARLQQLKLRDKHPDDFRENQRLAKIDQVLAKIFESRGNYDQARALLEESIHFWNAGTRGASNPAEATWEQLRSMVFLCELFDPSLQRAQFEQWDENACLLFNQLRSTAHHAQAVLSLTHLHRRAASQLGRLGASDRARRLLEADLRLIESLPAAASLSEIVLSREITRAALGADPSHIDRLVWAHGDDEKSPEGRDKRTLYHAEIMAWQIGWRTLGGQPPQLAWQQGSAAAWAGAIVARLEARRAALGLAPSIVPRIVMKLQNHASAAAAGHRREGNLPAARRVATQLHALAECVVGLYPDYPEAHMVLSEAWIQIAKNAWKDGDLTAIETCSRQALAAARHALVLDPEYDDARRLVDDRRRRLDGLKLSKDEG